jgi:hypothetical protein
MTSTPPSALAKPQIVRSASSRHDSFHSICCCSFMTEEFYRGTSAHREPRLAPRLRPFILPVKIEGLALARVLTLFGCDFPAVVFFTITRPRIPRHRQDGRGIHVT